ncbi:FbpB family small basic protein [Sporolactobacillus shoreicorticis]|uniref:FbpB family small basic protein n=1 Tax=Sporolactobacillus shoreicorticis TaxID=1923877 RepID=A0ABW5S1I3_9BACL|nr:FbpB family small basic protein [Sporolactobacillus shoreicorticis]MCO7125244.1 FbpB family small basic protein [Sporolactobacillus shoreicorticis]
MRKKLRYRQLIQSNKREILNSKHDLDRIEMIIDQRRVKKSERSHR